MCCIGGWTNSAPWPLSHWVIPRRPGPAASLPSQLTYSPTPNRALRPQQQAQAPFLLPRRSSETQRAGVATEGSSSVGRAASLVVSPVRPRLPRWRPSAEHPRAGDSNDSSGGAAFAHLRGVSYQQLGAQQRIPGHSSGSTRPSLAPLKWLREWLLGEACRGWGVAQLSGEEKSEAPVPL